MLLAQINRPRAAKGEPDQRTHHRFRKKRRVRPAAKAGNGASANRSWLDTVENGWEIFGERPRIRPRRIPAMRRIAWPLPRGFAKMAAIRAPRDRGQEP